MTMIMSMLEKGCCLNSTKHVNMKASGKQRKKWSEDMMDACLKEIPKKCTHCGSIDGHKFIQMANGKTSQPRYKCKDCSNLFTHTGGKAGVVKKITHDLKTTTFNEINSKLEQDEQEDEDYLRVPIKENKIYPPLIRPCLERNPVFIEGIKKMSDAEKMAHDENGEDFCYVDEYFDDCGQEIQEFVFVEYVKERTTEIAHNPNTQVDKI